MKFATLLSTESFPVDTKPGPAVPPLAKVDPEDVPTSVLKELTPNLEEEAKEGVMNPFPSEYVPSELDSLKVTVEALDYATTLAEDNLNLIQSTSDIVQGEETLAPISMASIAAQLNVAKRTSLNSDAEMIDKLQNSITSDSPYKVIMTMEALVKTLAALRPVIIGGLKTIQSVNGYIKNEVDLTSIAKNLTAAKEALTPVERQFENDISTENSLKYLPLITKAIENNQEPEYIPEYISKTENIHTVIPVTACALLAKSMKSIRLTHAREIDVKDINELSSFLDTVLFSQKTTSTLLESTLSNINISELSEKGVAFAAADIKRDTGLFWGSVAKLSESSDGVDTQVLQITNVENTRIFEVMKGWVGVVLFDTGKSTTPEMIGGGSYGRIDNKDLSDIVDNMINLIIPKFKRIAANSEMLSQKVEQIGITANKTLADNQILSDVGFQNFQSTFFRIIDAVKLLGNLTFTATKAVSAVTDSIIDTSKAVSILRETV